MSKEWKMWEADSCPECGCMPEVLTDAELGYAFDSDDVRCPECDTKGGMTVDEDGDAYINWAD